MALFENSEELKDVLYNFFLELAENTEITEKLIKEKTLIRFNYSEPDLAVTIDCTQGEKPVVMADNTEVEPELELWMTADLAHKFWLGKVNLVAAMTLQQMKVKGPVTKLIMLLPAIAPAYKLYPDYLKRRDLNKYLSDT